ncbi:MAG TPA: Type 1 glutamine amidotransferase-like domain-containing protein [Actinomycetota bacterium]|nr:Type 1 glutamine amidotransferase-like domain-containing protein [Actinomycetota bacterium]
MIFALLGSGEFEPWSAEVDRWALSRATGDGRVLILPTASASEGDDVFGSWASKGLEHFANAGIDTEVVAIKTRADADRPDLVARLEGASAAYFSGGNPWYLSETLRDTAFLRAMLGRMQDGLAYIGCSAGVACLTEMTYDSDTEDFEQVFKPGLGLVRRVQFGPHWDMIDTWIPGATEFIVGAVPNGATFVGIDEDTAMVGDGRVWSVLGRQSVHVRRGDEWERYTGGGSFELDLGAG